MEWSERTSEKSSNPENTSDPLEEVPAFGPTIEVQSYEEIMVNLNKQRMNHEMEQKDREKKERAEMEERDRAEGILSVGFHCNRDEE